MNAAIITPFDSRYEDYLKDESRVSGNAEYISFPECENDVVSVVKKIRSEEICLTVQGARTGITGGAVPRGGAVMNMSKMRRITGLRRDSFGGRYVLAVEPGVLLSDINTLVSSREFSTGGWDKDSIAALEAFKEGPEYMFPPDPTETSASIGGIISCNASGARSFAYGSARNFIKGIRLVFPDGSAGWIRRGEEFASGRSFILRNPEGVSVFSGRLPSYIMPDVKNAAGYYASDDMDLMDLFIGMEGTLGIIVAAEMFLVPRPAVSWGMMIFMPDEEGALRLVETLRGLNRCVETKENKARLCAVEFFNSSALDLLRRQKSANQAFAGLPELPPACHTAVYLEFEGESEDDVMEAVMKASDTMKFLGGDEDATWLADNNREMSRLKFFRHAVPEAVNLEIDDVRTRCAGVSKLGTDMAFPGGHLLPVMRMYNSELERAELSAVIFGHIGDNHLHVNIMPRNPDEFGKGMELYHSWAERIVKMGGTVSAEHGTGKNKTVLLDIMYGNKSISEMRNLKKIFDPRGLLNRGNMFEWID